MTIKASANLLLTIVRPEVSIINTIDVIDWSTVIVGGVVYHSKEVIKSDRSHELRMS